MTTETSKRISEALKAVGALGLTSTKRKKRKRGRPSFESLIGSEDKDKRDLARARLRGADAMAKFREVRTNHILGKLVDAAIVRDGLARAAAALRRTGEALASRCGPEAAEILRDGLEAAEAEIERFMAEAANAATAS